MRVVRTLLIVALVAISASATAAASTRVAMIGDSGTDSADQSAVASLASGWSADGLVLLGDNYYSSVGLPSGTGRYDRTVGKYYCGFLSGAASGPECAGGTSPSNRLWPALGNHDYSDAGIANYLAYFALPGNERYYDTRIGDVHVFILDSDEALRSSTDMDAQRAWLQAALAVSTAPFRVVVLHHPPYTSSSRGPYTALRWPFAAWGAHLVVTGHDHFYERLEVDGIPYLVNGAGGQALTAFPSSPAPESRVGYSGSHGALRVSTGEGTMTAEFVSVDGIVRDAVTIGGSASGAPLPAAPLPAATVSAAPPVSAPCTQTVYQQGARKVSYDRSRRAYRVVSRLRVMEDPQPWCRTSLTVIYRNARTKVRATQAPGSTLGYRTLSGRDFSAPVIAWPTSKEMRFTSGDPSGAGRRNARLVLVSYVKKTAAMPALAELELAVVRRIPGDASASASATNPLRAQVMRLGRDVGWAGVT